MSSKEVPDPWASVMRRRGLTRADGVANISALARKAGLATETARRAVHGIGVTRPDTVSALMEVLGPDVQKWLGTHVELGPYEPPSESSMLTSRQRDALTELIRSMTERRAEDGDGRGQQSAPTSNVTPLPAAGDVDDSQVPDDVAARRTDTKSRTQQARDAQDESGES